MIPLKKWKHLRWVNYEFYKSYVDSSWRPLNFNLHLGAALGKEKAHFHVVHFCHLSIERCFNFSIFHPTTPWIWNLIISSGLNKASSTSILVAYSFSFLPFSIILALFCVRMRMVVNTFEKPPRFHWRWWSCRSLWVRPCLLRWTSSAGWSSLVRPVGVSENKGGGGRVS